MNWFRDYWRLCRGALRAAAIYQRDGDEHAYDLRLAALTRPTPLGRIAAAVTLTSHIIGVGLLPVVRASVKAANDFNASLERIQRIASSDTSG